MPRPKPSRGRPVARRPVAAVESLEDRALLSATFALTGDALALGGFTQVADENLTLRENGSAYEFVLSEGIWSGTDGGGVTGAGTGRLSVEKSAVAGLAGGIDVDASGVSADLAFAAADLSTLAGGLEVDGAGAVTQAAGTTLTVSGLDLSAVSFALSGSIVGGTGAVSLVASRNIALTDGASIATTSGAILLNANEAGTAADFDGVVLAGAAVTTETGAITIRGRAGSVGDDGAGVLLSGRARIVSTGTAAGAVTVSGTAAGIGIGTGVRIAGDGTEAGRPLIESATGDLTIEGTLATTSGPTAVGGNAVHVERGGRIASTGTGADAATISITGTAGGGRSHRGVILMEATVTSRDGDVTILGTVTAAGNFAVGTNVWPSAVVESTGIGADAADISITGVVVNGPASSGTNDGVHISHSAVRSHDGDIAITGTGGGGILLLASTLAAEGAGAVLVTGTSLAENTNSGLAVTLYDTTIATTTGIVSIAGTSYYHAIDAGGSSVTSAYGDITIAGTALGRPTGPLSAAYAVRLTRETSVTSTGTGPGAAEITIEGYASSPSLEARWGDGLVISDASIRSIDGDITLRGEGYGGADGSGYGVRLNHSSEIVSTGTGADAASISITGIGGGGWGGAGVEIEEAGLPDGDFPGAAILSVDGDIFISGEATGSTPPDKTSYSYANGVTVFSGEVAASGLGQVVISGTGPIGDEWLTGSGVYIAESGAYPPMIRAGAGDVSISGFVPVRAGRDTGGKGVEVVGRATIEVIDGGTLVLSGTGDNAPDVLISGTVRGIDGGRVELIADRLYVDPTAVIDAGAGTALIRTRTAGRAIDLGGEDTPTALGLSDAELDRVTAGTLLIGDALAGDLRLVGPVTQAGGGYAALGLVAGGSVLDATAGEQADLAVGRLTITAGGGIGGGGDADLDLAVSRLAADAGGTVAVSNAGALTLGHLAGTDIAVAASGTVAIEPGAVLDTGRLDLAGRVPPGRPLVIVASGASSPLSGSFAGLPEGATVGTADGASVRITYRGGDGNDIALVVPVPVVTVSASSGRVLEDGSAAVVYTFHRTEDISQALTVNFTVGGTAAPGDDYALAGAATFSGTSRTVVFAAGSATAVVELRAVAGAVVERNETAVLAVAAGPGYAVGSAAAATTLIANDDGIGLVTGNMHVAVYDPTGSRFRLGFYPYNPPFQDGIGNPPEGEVLGTEEKWFEIGGVRVAVGDVNGDGVADIVTAPASGAAPLRVVDGLTGTLLRSFYAFPENPDFGGGITVALADVNRDEAADIILSVARGSGPAVRVVDGRTGAELSRFWAFAENSGFRGGVNLAAADVDGDGDAEVVAAIAGGAGPAVRVLEPLTGGIVSKFWAFAENPGFLGGVNVAAGDVDGDGRAEVIATVAGGSGPAVRVLDALSGATVSKFWAFPEDTDFLSGVNVGVTDIDRDGRVEVLAAPAADALIRVRFIDPLSGRQLRVIQIGQNSRGGSFVAGQTYPAAAEPAAALAAKPAAALPAPAEAQGEAEEFAGPADRREEEAPRPAGREAAAEGLDGLFADGLAEELLAA